MEMTLGEIFRDARREKGVSLRAFAVQMEITPPYLSDIENDRRIPAEDVLKRLADALGLDFEYLMARAGRFGAKAERYMKRHPDAFLLIRRCAELGLSAEELRLLEVKARLITEERGKPPVKLKVA